MLTILHVSDLHFGPRYVPPAGEALLRSAAAIRPDVIVASGDFTQRAKAVQFAAAREFLDRLPDVPKIVVPGNHDVPLYRVFERLFAPYANYRKYICQDLDTVYRREDAVFVALNTAAPRSAIVNGGIDRRQLDFCAAAFRDAPPGAARIVVAHHHFAPAPDFDDKHDVLRGARRALDRFGACDVDLILGGHLHRGFIGNSLDVYPGQDRRHGIILVQSGTTTSARGRAREREKNSFNVIRLGRDTVHVAHWMYFHEQGGFETISRHEFTRRPRTFLGDVSAND